MTNNDSIKKLFSDGPPFNDEDVVSVIHHFVTVDRKEVEIYFKPDKKITNKDKILLYGLTLKVLKSQGFIDSESFAPSNLEEIGLKGGSVRPSIKNLENEKGFIIGSNKNYKIPNYKVAEILEIFNKKIKNE